MTEIRWIQGQAPGFEDALAVRSAVFVEEQGYTAEGEQDARDADSAHVVVYRQGRPAATARLFYEADGTAHIGRVAVLQALRGQGLGLWLMQTVLARAAAEGAQRVVLSAQADKTRFYERAGFAPTGVHTLDEGRPHVEMARLLNERADSPE